MRALGEGLGEGSVAVEGSQPARKARRNHRIFRVDGKTRGVEDAEHVKHAWAVCFGCSVGRGARPQTPKTSPMGVFLVFKEPGGTKNATSLSHFSC